MTSALFGLAKVLQSCGVLPRIGSFPMDWFQPLLFWLARHVALSGDAERRAQENRPKVLHLMAYTFAAVAITRFCLDYYRIGQIIPNLAMFFFGPLDVYDSVVAEGFSIWACWRSGARRLRSSARFSSLSK